MKIVSIILVAVTLVPLCMSVATTYIADNEDPMPDDYQASLILVSYKLSSEPALMVLFGTAMIAIAGIGRKRLIKKDKDLKRAAKLGPRIHSYPDPVRWKKE